MVSAKANVDLRLHYLHNIFFNSNSSLIIMSLPHAFYSKIDKSGGNKRIGVVYNLA